ncbi:MAG: iron ABC transporter permease [Verrucomicrobia bacterium]|nr:iron ABC transporter permease [Verrucomicrobiota bacterium]
MKSSNRLSKVRRGIFVLFFLGLWALALGSAGLGWGHDYQLLALRFPRVIAAVVAGFALGVGGGTQQGLFRNPLADPGLTGVFGGALLGIAIIMAGGGSWVWEHTWAISLAAFLGATAISILLVMVGGRGSTSKLLLTGLGLNAFAAAGTLIIANLFSSSRDVLLSGITGDWLGLATFSSIAWPMGLCVVASLFLISQGRSLDQLSLGEDVAQTRGLDVNSVRRRGILFTALAAAAATCLVGQVAFIGLIAPHFARLLIGPRHKTMLLLSGIIGAILLLLADTLGRSAWPQTPLSAAAMTALLGAPVFIWIASRHHE